MPSRIARAVAQRHPVTEQSLAASRRLFLVFVALVTFHTGGKESMVNAHKRSHLLLRQTLAACTYDDDCVANAYCWKQETCMCKEGYLVDRNHTHVQCLRVATNIGDSCNEDVQCRVTFTAQAECRNNTCLCSPGSHFEEGRCYESIGIGKVCQTSRNCYVEGSASFCVDGYCACPLQHHRNVDGNRCLKTSLLGDECTEDEECTTIHSRCFDVCGCKVDYVLSSNGQRCLKAANEIGDPCDEDSQCREFLKNSKCGDDGKCACNINFKRQGALCHRDSYTRMLGRHCDTFRDCVQGPIDTESGAFEVTRVGCIDNVCSCTRDYELTEDGHDCIGFSDINDFSSSSRCQMHWIVAIIIVSTILRYYS